MGQSVNYSMFKGLCEKMLFSFPVRFRYQFKIKILVLYEVKPSIIISVLHPNSPSWILRPADGGLLVIPRICLETSGGDCAFPTLPHQNCGTAHHPLFAPLTLWHPLKKQFKTHLFLLVLVSSFGACFWCLCKALCD